MKSYRSAARLVFAALLLAVLAPGPAAFGQQAETTLTATPALLGVLPPALHNFKLSANLRGPNGPLAGKPILFNYPIAHDGIGFTSRSVIATTDATGTAHWDASASAEPILAFAVLHNNAYTAYFVGDAGYSYSIVDGALIE